MEYRYRTRDTDTYPAIYGYTPRITLFPWYILLLLQYPGINTGSIPWIRIQVITFQWCIPGIPPGNGTCYTGSILWVLYIRIQCPIPGYTSIRYPDSYSIHGIYTPLGANELLGSNCNHQPIYRYPLYGTLVPGGLLYYLP